MPNNNELYPIQENTKNPETNIGITEIDSVDYEDEIYDVMNSNSNMGLDELLMEYRKRVESAENDEEFKLIYNQLRNALEQRRGKFWEFKNDDKVFENNLEKDLSDRTRKKIEEIIDKARAGKLDFLGKGFTAEVFAAENSKEVCFKIIKDLSEYKQGVTIDEEAEIQRIASREKIDGVKAPKPYYYIMTKDFHLMVMERLDAITIEEAEVDPHLLPDNFNEDKFFSQLENYLDWLHEQGVYHRDLHARNIMIDLKTGEPRVIDFGKSKKNMPSGIKDDKNDIVYKKNFNREETIYRNDYTFGDSKILIKKALLKRQKGMQYD